MDMTVLLSVTLIFILCCFVSRFTCRRSSQIPRYWPLLGMIPSLMLNLRRIYDWITEVLEETGMTFLFEGPSLAKMDMLVTVDPANIHYILSSNSSDFPKGPEFRRIFEVLGDGIFNADSEQWSGLRKSAHSLMGNSAFLGFLAKTGIRKIEEGLLRVLDRAAETKSIVDLQDLFQRLTFDTTFVLLCGFDPASLSLDLPENEFARAMDDAEEALFHRHVKPEFFWSLQKWFGVGKEKMMTRACDTLERSLAECLSLKRQKMKKFQDASPTENIDLLTSYIMMARQEAKSLPPDMDTDSDRFLRDTMLNLMFAGRDTISSALSWFFWLIAKNPDALSKIRDEIDSKIQEPFGQTLFEAHEMNKLVYLHGALREALRLYPPVPFQHKYVSKPTTLPSGHSVYKHTRIIIPLYALGRSRSVWGEDAATFQPERWISERGKLKHEPSYKFLAFNAGPRTCLGKGIALAQMMAVVVALLRRYEFELVEGAAVEPCVSILLHMKRGLRVRVTSRALRHMP